MRLIIKVSLKINCVLCSKQKKKVLVLHFGIFSHKINYAGVHKLQKQKKKFGYTEVLKYQHCIYLFVGNKWSVQGK